jgi:hypothetical protein
MRPVRINRVASRIAWTLWALAVCLSAALVWLTVLSADSPGPLEYADTPAIVAVYVLLALMYPTLGALIASRHPSNVIGWMFCAAGLAISGAACAQLYADYALYNEPGSLPGGDVAFWVSSWLFPGGLFATPTFLMFLFPTGRPTTRSWTWVVRFAVVVLILGFTSSAIIPGKVEPPSFGVVNPFGVHGPVGEFAAEVNAAGQAALPLIFLLGIVCLVARRRRSHGDERQQIRWFGYAATMMALSFGLSFASVTAGVQALADAFFVIGAIFLACIPLASGLAILKYRLYDIDVVINRTLVYALLTAILAAIYVALVFGFQAILAPITAESDLAIASSTLAVAALFRPVRLRVQNFIDHRFYRRKFDAQRTLEDFSEHLRDEVDLGALSSRLTGVVGETMQPAHVSLWLRTPEAVGRGS